jgi:hypothetical protein
MHQKFGASLILLQQRHTCLLVICIYSHNRNVTSRYMHAYIIKYSFFYIYPLVIFGHQQNIRTIYIQTSEFEKSTTYICRYVNTCLHLFSKEGYAKRSTIVCKQGCQMLYVHTKYASFGIFRKALG